MFALGVFIHIHSIGLFTNIALNGTLYLFADMALSRLQPIRLLSESISIWLFGHNRIINRFDISASAYRPRLRCCQQIWSLLRLSALSQPNSRLLPQEGHIPNTCECKKGDIYPMPLLLGLLDVLLQVIMSLTTFYTQHKSPLLMYKCTHTWVIRCFIHTPTWSEEMDPH